MVLVVKTDPNGLPLRYYAVPSIVLALAVIKAFKADIEGAVIWRGRPDLAFVCIKVEDGDVALNADPLGPSPLSAPQLLTAGPGPWGACGSLCSRCDIFTTEGEVVEDLTCRHIVGVDGLTAFSKSQTHYVVNEYYIGLKQ